MLLGLTATHWAIRCL